MSNENTITSSTSKSSLWAGRIITGLVVLFLVFDGVTKVIRVPAVIKASSRLGLSVSSLVAIGVVLLLCTALYVIPQTSILGAVLLTGYLGGAVATQLLANSPLFSETLFPVYFGIFVWAGIYLRDVGLRALMPVRN